MKKSLKGFTLVEIIIAFAIFSIIAILLAGVVGLSGNQIANIQQTNKKIDNHNMSYAAYQSNAPASDKSLKTDPSGNPLKIAISIGGTSDVLSTVNINVQAYEKDKKAIEDAKAKTPSTLTDDEKKLIRDADTPNLKYVKLP